MNINHDASAAALHAITSHGDAASDRQRSRKPVGLRIRVTSCCLMPSGCRLRPTTAKVHSGLDDRSLRCAINRSPCPIRRLMLPDAPPAVRAANRERPGEMAEVAKKKAGATSSSGLHSIRLSGNAFKQERNETSAIRVEADCLQAN